MYFIGIDISKYKHDCFIISNTGEIPLDGFSFKNTKLKNYSTNGFLQMNRKYSAGFLVRTISSPMQKQLFPVNTCMMYMKYTVQNTDTYQCAIIHSSNLHAAYHIHPIHEYRKTGNILKHCVVYRYCMTKYLLFDTRSDRSDRVNQ